MRLTKILFEVLNGFNGVFFCLIVILGNTVGAVKLYDELRLPLTLIPYHYDLKLLTYLEDSPDIFRYIGSVNISVHAQTSTNLVVLHVRDAIIEEQKIQIWDKKKGELFNISRTEYNREKDYFIIEVHLPFVRGRSYVLTLPFQNKLSEDFKSGYFVGYNEGKNELDRSWFSLTQFERNYIRNVFPSFDEPALRATFNVTLGHHRRFQSFSNMPLLRRFNSSDLKDYVWSMHEVSPLMPTYLLAFSINNFTCMFSTTFGREPVEFRTCSHVTQVQALSLASLSAPKLFQYFETLFQVPCPLRKIQQLAIPHMPIAAMENWGLVVYSDEMIMQKNQKNLTNLTQGQTKTLQLVSHEMVHMWFGNLVTISWWDSLWLNEGLAGYFEAAGVEYLQMNSGRKILFKYREGSLMNELMDKPVAINASSDKGLIENSSVAYVYQKVTTIVRMLNAMLGDEVFYEGLYFYLSQYSYSNTTPDQFWGKMQMASIRSGVLPDDHKVNTIMDSWTNQAGYPVLDVIRNYNNNTISFVQNHFSSNESHSEVWWIPLTYTTQSERNFSSTRTKAWLIQPSMHLNMPLLTEEWVMFNIQAVGYYRVNYDEHNWRLIASDLYENHKRIHVLNRAQIVSDCLYLWQQGRIRWLTAVDVLKYIIEEDEYEPLVAFVLGVTNGFWGMSPDSSLIIAKWLGSAGKWYAEFINYTFNCFVLIKSKHFRQMQM